MINPRIRSVRSKSGLENLVLLGLAAIFFMSSAGALIFKIGGRYVPEIPAVLMLAYMAINRRKLLAKINRCTLSPLVFFGLVYFAVLAIIGIAIIGDPISAYREFRAGFVLLFAFMIFYKPPMAEDKMLRVYIWLTLAVIAIDLITLQIRSTAVTDDISKFPFTTMAVFAVIYIAFRKGYTITASLAIAIGLMAGTMSNYRIQIFIVILCLILFLPVAIGAQVTRRQWSVFFKTIMILSIASVIIGVFTYTYFFDLFRPSEFRTRQVLDRTTNTLDNIKMQGGLSGFRASEPVRYALFEYMFLFPNKLILPHGLGSRGSQGNVDPWFDQFDRISYASFGGAEGTMDNGLLYLSYHHGLIFTLPLIIWFFINVFRRLRGSNSRTDKYYVITAIFVWVLININDPQLTAINKAFFAGSIMAIILNPRYTYEKVINAAKNRRFARKRVLTGNSFMRK